MPDHATSLSAADVAATYGIPKRTVLAAIKRGDLAASKLGHAGIYVIQAADANKFAKRWNARQERRDIA